jgi:hypothetical protein
MTNELLVHVSTPATRQNDELYQSLADAYLNFEPHTVHSNRSQEQAYDTDEPTESSLIKSTGPTRTSFNEIVDCSFLLSSKDSYGSFPSHVSSDGHAKGHVTSDGRSYQEEDSSIPPSSRLAQLEHIHQNWKQKTPKSSFVIGKRSLASIASSPEDADTAFIEDTQLAAQGVQSQLQDSYSTTSEDTSEGDTDLEEGTEQVSLARTNHNEHRASITRETSVPTATAYPKSVSTVAEGWESSQFDGSTTPLIVTVQSGFEGPKNTNDIQGITQSFNFSQLSVDAFPPAPKISVARPGILPSQITKQLAALKQQNPTRFKPSKKQRAQRSDERGYWSIDCSHWSEKLQHEFWTTMCEQIMSGRLGWDATLHRDAGSPRSLGQVKLYCWGEVAEHMWLMLWLCSEGKVSGSALKWYDADGVAIVEVL